MKKIIYIFVALLAFAVGVFVFLIRPRFITIPFFELKGRESIYKFKKVKVRGQFQAVKNMSGYDYYLDDSKNPCLEKNYLVCHFGLPLELSEEIVEREISVIQEIADKNELLSNALYEKDRNGTLEQKDYDERVEYTVDVEIVGYIDEKKLDKPLTFGAHTSTHLTIMKVQEMKIISPVRLVKVNNF